MREPTRMRMCVCVSECVCGYVRMRIIKKHSIKKLKQRPARARQLSVSSTQTTCAGEHELLLGGAAGFERHFAAVLRYCIM